MKTKKKILILVETSRIYGRQIIEGITRFALENGDWIVFLEDKGLSEEPDAIEMFPCDGIITRTLDSEYSKHLEAMKIPIIELLGDGEYHRSDVLCDGETLGIMAADHFLGKGFRNFAYFSMGHSWWADQFHHSYTRTLNDAGYSCYSSPLCLEENSVSLPLKYRKGIEMEVIRWLDSLPKPTGLFCPSDSQAILILNMCQIAGITVPHKISVLGVENNMTLCNATSPPLSSISVNGFETGYQAALLLNKKLRNETLPPLPILIPPIGVVTRESTDSIAVADFDVSKALHFISQRVKSITVKQVANHVSISVRTLIRKFHETLGHTPEEEIMRVRIERAKVLLYETDMSINTIAENVGYASKEYFIRFFKSKMKMTPHQYRQSVRSLEDDS